jgi:hypothetical protein
MIARGKGHAIFHRQHHHCAASAGGTLRANSDFPPRCFPGSQGDLRCRGPLGRPARFVDPLDNTMPRPTHYRVAGNGFGAMIDPVATLVNGFPPSGRPAPPPWRAARAPACVVFRHNGRRRPSRGVDAPETR